MSFFHFISKKKIIAGFLSLFFIAIIAVYPVIANAQAGDVFNTGVGMPTVNETTSQKAVEEAGNIKCPGLLSSPSESIYCGILVGISDLIGGISYRISWIFGYIYSETLSYTNEKPITTSKAFSTGWTQVRDLSNMLIVLGFVIVGISFSLRIEGYGTKKVFFWLIIVALLINFSGLFCGLVMDASTIVQKSLSSTNASQGTTLIDDLYGSYEKYIKSEYTGNSPAKYLQTTLWYSAFMLVTGFTFVILAIILIERYAILAILYILSPLACIAFVFPASKKLWTEWWNYFLKWTFVGVQVLFFIYIANQAMNKSYMDASWIELTVFLILMIVGAKIAIKSSGAMGAAAIGMATTGFGAVAAGGGKALLNSRAGQWAKDKATRAGEKVGIVAPGTANLARQKALQEHESEKRATTWSAEDRQRIATGRAVTRRQRNDKMEAIKQMGEKGELGKLSDTEFTAAMDYHKSLGGSAAAMAEKDYRAAGYGKTGAAAQAAKNTQLSENLPKMSGKQIRNISWQDIDRTHNPEAYNLVKEQFTPNMARQLKTADQDLKDTFNSHIGAAGQANTLADDIDKLEKQIAATVDQATKNSLTKKKDELTRLKDALEKATT